MRRFVLLLAIALQALSCLPHPPSPPPPPAECPACPAAVVPPGCPPCPPVPPPAVTTGHLDGVAVDAAGNALAFAKISYRRDGQPVGEAIAIGKPQSDAWCNARPQPCSPAPVGYFSKPGDEPFGLYVLHAVLPDGREGDSKPIAFGAAWRPTKVAFAIPEIPVPPVGAGRCALGPDALRKHFTKGTFTYSLSYYGGNTAPFDRFNRDMAAFSARNICNIRFWVDFPKNGDTFRTFNRDGTPKPGALDKLAKYVEIASSHGVSIEFTFQSDGYNFAKKSEEGYDIHAHENAVAAIATRFKGNPGVSDIDVANEGKKRGGPSQCNGSPEWSHMSPGRMFDIYRKVMAIDPSRRLTLSADGDVKKPGKCAKPGDDDTIVSYYKSVLSRGTKIFLTPHFPRTSSAPENEGPNTAYLIAQFPGLVVYNQEPFRRGLPGDNNAANWTAENFITAFKGARAAGSVGMCLHNGHWSMAEKDMLEQLDAVERKVVDWIATQ